MSIFARMNKDRTIVIRPMRSEDIERVREVGQIAWSDLAMQDIGRRFRYPKRSEKLVESYMAIEPEGCLVAEVGGTIVGSAFCHVWGRVGWIGPLEVLPDNQNGGVGKALLSACERHLSERGCDVIGLETMSHLPKNLHFYLTSGYVPTSMVLIMEKRMLDNEVHTQFVEDVDASVLMAVLGDIARLGRELSPSLDYTEEARMAVERRMGRLFVSKRDGEVVGFAILHTYQKDEEARYSSIKALIADPGRSDQMEIFDALLDRCEQASASMGKDHVLVRLSTLSPDLYQHMLSRSYLLKGANVRMVKKGNYEENGKYHITSWAG